LYPNLEKQFRERGDVLGTIRWLISARSSASTCFKSRKDATRRKRYHASSVQVSKPVLERAFVATYGMEMKDVFGNLDLALGSFRYSVSSIIPGMTKVAWQLKAIR